MPTILRGARTMCLLALLATVDGGAAGAASPPTGGPGSGRAAAAHAGTRAGSVSTLARTTSLPSGPTLGPGAPEGAVDEGQPPTAPADPGAVVGGPPSAPSPLAARGLLRGAEDLAFTKEPVTVAARRDDELAGVAQIAEPQVATGGQRMLVTWNWYAAQSFDGGDTFSYLDPGEGLSDLGFCCDQLAAHLPSSDLWIWVRQALQGADRTNLVRISVAHGPDAFDAATFHDYDFTAQDFGYGDAVWLDQPRLGWSDRYLFLTINAFHALSDDINEFVGAAVWRIQIADLVSDVDPIGFSWFATGGDDAQVDASFVPLFSLSPVVDAGAAMYLAAHFSTSTLMVWQWPDDAEGFRSAPATTVDSDGTRVAYRSTGGMDAYSCPIDGAVDLTSDWCHGTDERITSGWRRGGNVGWAWTVPQGDQRPYPSVWAVEVDPARLDVCDAGGCITSWTQLWFTDAAAAYPALAPNADGDLGGVVLVGGGTYHPMCYAIARSADAIDSDPWQVLRVTASEVDTAQDRLGDYLGATSEPGERSWTGACISLQADRVTGVHIARFERGSR